MAQLQLDFSNVQSFDPLPNGSYSVMIEQVVAKETVDKPGSYYLNWDLVVTNPEFENRHLFFMTSLSEKALWRLQSVLMNLGVLSTDQTALEIEVDDDTGILTSPDLNGVPATAVVKIEIYQGRKQNRVDDLVAIVADEPVVKAPPTKVTPIPRQPVIPKVATAKPKLNLK